MQSIQQNLEKILNRIQVSAERRGRKKEEVTLVAVTKRHSASEIAELKRLGIKIIGESRVQELEEKFTALKDDFEIHFIGHLQTNKVKQAVRMSHAIHSVDSLKVAAAIDEECAKLNKKMDVLIQVNASLEPQKSGIAPDGLEALLTEAEPLVAQSAPAAVPQPRSGREG